MRSEPLNSRERVLTVFAHQQPDRIPCWCGASVEFWTKAKNQLHLDDEGLRRRFGDDFRRIYAGYAGPEMPVSAGCTYKTIFGIERTGLGYGQPTHHPLADASLKQVHDYPWPEPKWMDVSKIKSEAQKYKGRYAILGGDWSPFFHDAIDLLGMENLFLKMYSEPELADAVFTHIVDYYFEVSKRIFDAAAEAIDIFFFGNDFGSQTGPLISPDLFRRFFMPHLKRLCDLGHSYGLKNQIHCCGGIFELIPLLIEAGLDGIHAIQPDCRGMDLQKLKKEFGDKIVLNGAIDSHNILIDGNPEFVRQKIYSI
jgi:uroporphyrinogen decarboxylase